MVGAIGHAKYTLSWENVVLLTTPVDLMGRLSNPPGPLETLVGQGIGASCDRNERASRSARHSPSDSHSARQNNQGQLSNPLNKSPGTDAGAQVTTATQPFSSNQVLKRLRTGEVDDLVDSYRAGGRIDDLAQRFGVHRTTVMTHLHRRHISPRPILTAWDDDALTVAADLYTNGESLASVAGRFGINPSTVANRFRRAGVTIRPRRGWIPQPRTSRR